MIEIRHALAYLVDIPTDHDSLVDYQISLIRRKDLACILLASTSLFSGALLSRRSLLRCKHKLARMCRRWHPGRLVTYVSQPVTQSRPSDHNRCFRHLLQPQSMTCELYGDKPCAAQSLQTLERPE